MTVSFWTTPSESAASALTGQNFSAVKSCFDFLLLFNFDLHISGLMAVSE